MKQHQIIHIIKQQKKQKRTEVEQARDQKEIAKYEVIS